MNSRVDVILEGVKLAELENLRALDAGRSPQFLQPLEDKGWVETVAGIPLITLTGRTLLDRRATQ